MTCTCAGTAPGYPQHEYWCGWPENDKPERETDRLEARYGRVEDWRAGSTTMGRAT
jgi:hypothetical protein